MLVFLTVLIFNGFKMLLVLLHFLKPQSKYFIKSSISQARNKTQVIYSNLLKHLIKSQKKIIK